MDEKEFELVAGEEWDKVPALFADKIKNVVLLVEDEPSAELKKQEKLEEGDTLLGFYHGIPNTERGENYGVGGTLPDSITLFRLPILEEAKLMCDEDEGEIQEFPRYVREVVRETIWHE